MAGMWRREVRRAADRRAHAEGILDSLAVDDLPCRDGFPDQLDDLAARGLGGAQPGGVRGGNGGRARQAHPHRLRHAAHGVGRAKKRAGAAGRRHLVFEAAKRFFIEFARLEHARAPR